MNTALIAGLASQYKYLAMIPASMLGGPLIGMLSGFLIRVGGLAFWPSYIALMTGELIGDVFWYWMGYHYGERFARGFGKYIGITEEHIADVKRMFTKHNRRILLISKLTTGFGLAVVIVFTAGLSKIPFRRYMATNVMGQLIWTAGLIAMGYYLGNFYVQVNNVFDKISLVSVVVIALLCVMGFARYMGQRFIKRY